MSQVTTHVLDTGRGLPAAGITVRLYARGEGDLEIGSGVTTEDGRVPELGPDSLDPGVYILRFDTAEYFRRTAQPIFYPEVTVVAELDDSRHYHLPLLLSPFGYSTYRGS